MREHYNDVPGDIAGEDAEDLPGGFGVDNPDLNPDAMVDSVMDISVVGPDGDAFIATDMQPGDVAGTSIAEGQDSGASVDPADLL